MKEKTLKQKVITLSAIFISILLLSLSACRIPLQGLSSSNDSGKLISLTPTKTQFEEVISTQTSQFEEESIVFQGTDTVPITEAKAVGTSDLPPIPTEKVTNSAPNYSNETSELLYLSQGKLYRWDYVTGYTGLLVENVADFNVSPDGKKIALLRPHKMTGNGISLYDLDLLDYQNKQIYSLRLDIPRYENISISPDGSWLVYSSKDEVGKLYVLNIEKPDEAIEIGSCQEDEVSNCGFISWSPDSDELTWSDSKGVWHINLQQKKSSQLHPETVNLTDPKGAEINIDVHFQDLQWSPIGRYLLTKVVPIASGVSWHGILDTATGRLIRVPDSYDQSRKISSVLWASDGSLLIANAGGTLEHLTPFIKRWVVLATHDDLLISQNEYPFSSDLLPFTTSSTDNGTSTCISWIPQHDHPNYILNMSLDSSSSPTAILSFNLDKGELSKLIEIETVSEQILWSPDNSGALILGPHTKIQFLNLRNGELSDMRPKFGLDASHFQWLPPSPRS